MYSIQVISLMMLVFISIVYFCAKRKPTYQHKLFSALLVSSYLAIFMELITEVVLNSPNSQVVLKGYIPNIFYSAGMIVFFFVIYLYGRMIALKDTGFSLKAVRGTIIFPAILLVLSIFFNIVINRPGERSFRMGCPFIPLAGAYTAIIVISIFTIHRKELLLGEKVPIMTSLAMGLAAVVLQTLSVEYKFSSIVMVLGCYAFYITVESPDAAMMERLRYEKERADEANEAKSAFLANMSHEIRTPMNAIVGMTDILLRTETTEHQKSCLNNIKHSGKSLLLIINDLLDLSKIEAGKFELIEETYNPVNLLSDVGMLALTRIGERPIELLYDVDHELPDTMVGDPGRIRQILVNIVNNAVKYTERGYIRLSVRLEGNTGKTTDLVFAVEDTGQGIREEEQARLFDAFTQVDMKRNRGKDGTGLGLAICKNLAQLMGGDISVYSEYGNGSTFTVRIKQKILSSEKAVRMNRELYEGETPVIGTILPRYETSNLRKMVTSFGFQFKDISKEDLYSVDVGRILVDGEMFKERREEILKLADNGADIAVLLNPVKSSISEEKVHVINKPFYCYGFSKFMNRAWEDEEDDDSGEDFDFKAPEARILIVDDIDINLKVVEGLFSPIEMQVDTATSGKMAIEKARTKKYNLIFMDHMMPVMDGVETIKHIRELEEFEGYYKKAPIAALTANVGEDAREAFRSVDVKEFLTKPLDIKSAGRVIRRALPNSMISKKDKAERSRTLAGILRKSNNETAEEPVEVETMEPVYEEPLEAKEPIPEIEGIDSNQGISNSGSRNLWENLLGDFYSLIDMKATKIEKCFADGLIRDFTIEVHALKSTSRMIGAMGMSEEFKQMEAWGNEENTDAISEKLPALMEELRGYKEKLLPFAMKNESEKTEASTDEIIGVLERIAAAMENFDLDETDAAMKELEGYRLDEEMRPHMDNMRAYVADVAMEDIIKTANTMIDMLKAKQ